MRKFNSPSKDVAYFFFRIISPVLDPIRFIKGIYGYIWFVKDAVVFKFRYPTIKIFNFNLFPQIHDKTSTTLFDPQYYYQQLWCFEKVLTNKPDLHIDLASTYEMSGYISKITKSVMLDYRPLEVSLDNFESRKGDILKLEFKDNSANSISCLHVIEHIGLGRYGEPLDNMGMEKACLEISRVLSTNGKLYISTVIGKERMCFNAHRVTPPSKVIKMFNGLKLLSFSVVDDCGIFHENVDPVSFENQDYACGMFEFTK